ncbi:MAG: aminopeptidase [Oscillospiraceae bacterium]|nr:aminopeptidase [Oscillospiraceae bacterium]
MRAVILNGAMPRKGGLFMEKEKSIAKQKKEALFSRSKHAGIRMDEAALQTCDAFCEGYKAFLDAAKTEREAVNFSVAKLEEAGFRPFTPGMELKAGDRVYVNNRGKAVIMATIGTAPITEGVRLNAAHIDSPRLDLKQHPLYEDNEIALFKTHYYGGIKKYQWTAMPLSLHGVIVRADGSSVEVCIGEDAGDPVFCISDLLPHLAANQMKRTLHEGIKGEELNIIIGSRPFRDDSESELVKLAILYILHEKYGITEDDFISAELEAVPAYPAKDVGFDRSMIGAYGHDDRVCAYTAFMAALECKNPVHTGVTILTDKEETGSDGNTGLCSSYLKYFLYDLAETFGANGRAVISASKCLSADVNAAFDPTFPEVLERNNCAYFNHGVCVTKFTGARGKSGTSDASAEFVGEIRRLLDANDVIWQTGELGKVDMGGGGTVAAYIANLNIDTIDVGVPVLSMHAPYEMVAKTDVYAAYRAFLVFLES